MARKTTTVYGRRKSLFQRMAALTVTASLVLSTFAGAAVLAVEPEQPQQAYPAASDTAAFLDTEGHWAEDQVLRWNRLGIVNGVDAQHFAPNQQLTRVEFFAILGRALGGEGTADLSGFPDVDPTAWYAKDLSRAVTLGLTIGDENKNIHPNAFITREAMAVTIARAFCLDQKKSAALSRFTDGNKVSDWAAESVGAVVDAGLMNGKDNGLFDPQANATRAEAVTVLDNAVARLVQEDASGDVKGNALVNTGGVSFSNAVVSGWLYLSQGVGKPATLGNVTVQGDTLVLGGGFTATGSSFATLYIKADNAVVTLSKDCSVDRIVITGKNVSVLGACKAGSVEIEASGAVIETMPENVSLADGLTATVEGKAYPSQSGDSSGSNSSNSGSSSGGSGGSSSVKETGHTNEYDPENPYAGVNVGLFHNIPITVDENTSGVATYYLPRGMDPWAPAVIVLTPDNTTAKSFSGTKTGLAWRAVADENKIAVAFLGPQDGENWNLSLSADGRDDAALLDQLYQTMRKKGTNLKGAFSMDKSHTALVGYEEGGAAALLFGARWASDFSSICAVDAAEVPADSLAVLGEQYVLPFPGDSRRGVEELAIAAKTVDTPVWLINSAADAENKTVLNYYVTAAQAAAGTANPYAGEVYVSGREGSNAEIWVSTEAQTPKTIWNQFLGTYKRFMAMQLPGRVSKAQDFTETGFTIHEEEVNGEIRRWMTYVPSTYTGEAEVPLVLVMHGYTASMYAIAEESRWYDVAEENGFIVVFAQGLVRPADMMGNIPTAMWLAGPFSALAGAGVDKDTDLKFLDTLLDKLEEEYSIDTSRVYATGHSNGSLMTWAMGSKFADRFAAIAPVGYMSAPMDGIESGTMLPTWSFLGEYDSAGDPTLVEGGATVKALQGWNQQNGTNEAQMSTSKQYDDAFVTRTFANNDNVPLVKFTEVKNTPHVYLQEESEAIWNDFFSKYSRGEDGTLYYQASEESEKSEVTMSEYVADDGWYKADGDAGQTSPDAAAIQKSITAIAETDGFQLVNVPYECTTNHKNGEAVGSHPFSSMYCSVGDIDQLAERYGFGEMEFFMSGKANVYGLSDKGTNVPVIKTADVDYTTRLLIHYPEDAEKFSGNIYVDILNASAGYDLEDIFRRSYEHFMANGDIYIGITSKTTTAQALKDFDPERYAAIDWLVDNNDPDSAETGLFWDMLSQLGTVLKERPEDIFGTELGQKIKDNGRTYLVGQSQSGFYLQTYLMAFYPYINNVLDGKDIYDGYFNAVGSTPTTLSTGVKMENVGWPKTEEPYLVLMGEGEAKMRLSSNYYPLQEDKSEEDWKFRLYEAAGAPHADPTAAILPNNFEIAKAKANGTSRDIKPYKGNHVEGDLHLNEFVTAALVNLDNWARNGIAAPSADNHWLQADADNGKAVARDAYGNALGGLRSPKIDAPLATYFGCINDSAYSTEGSMIHFTQEQLDARYEGATQAEKYADYVAEFKASADAALEGRYITQADYDKLIAWSEGTSAFGQQDDVILGGQTDIDSLEIEWQDVSSDEIFNSTAMSVGQMDSEWNEKAPVWVPSLQLNDDGTIQYVNKSGESDVLSKKYTEKEYFVSGSANLYDIASDNRLMVREAGLPYTNRILVRTPENPEDFNGKVYVDILNASDKYDNESLWRRAYGMIMEKGAAYVGITSKPVCVAALQRFDDRYDALSWASPNSWLYTSYKIDKANGQTAEAAYEKFWVTAGELPYTDIGLVWDILSQTGYAIQENANDMFGTGKSVEGVYLYGQSQSGFVMNEYFRFMDFLKEKGEALPYDGFMNVVGTYPANKINQSDTTAVAKNTESYYVGKNLDVPVIYVTSQMDYNAGFRPGESNVDEDGMVALYEIAGAPHSDPAAPVFPYNDILTEMGYPARNLFPTFNQDQEVSDYNSNMFVQALLLQLDAWATEGTAPTVLDDPYITKNEDGTVTGGLRSPQLDVPVAHYYEKPLGSVFSTTGTMVPFTSEELKAAYKGYDDYAEQFDAALEKLVEAGLIRATDKAYMLKYRDSKAALFGENPAVLEMGPDVAPIDEALDTAGRAKDDVIISDLDATEVESGVQFVSAEAMDALDAAISAAEAAKESVTSQADVAAAAEALNGAVETFRAAIQTGAKEETPPKPDTAAIDEAIASANEAQNGIAVSDLDATEVESGAEFVSSAAMEALDTAIRAAEEARDTATSEADVAAAVEALNGAVETFEAAIQIGAKEADPA